jgi:hypothetical protein
MTRIRFGGLRFILLVVVSMVAFVMVVNVILAVQLKAPTTRFSSWVSRFSDFANKPPETQPPNTEPGLPPPKKRPKPTRMRRPEPTISSNGRPPLGNQLPSTRAQHRARLLAHWNTYDFVWEGGGYRFGRVKQSTNWVEIDGNMEVKFRFEESTQHTEDNDNENNNDYFFSLHDKSRDAVVITLSNRHARFHAGDSSSILGSGEWVVVEGEVRPTWGTEQDSLDGRVPPLPRLRTSIENATILVGIAAYRDPFCGNTLWEIFKNAKNPARVRVVVVQQLDVSKGDLDCLADYCNDKPNLWAC